jgi:predicted N-acetyltransferase YhbS
VSYSIQRLAAHHQRDGFDCGDAQLNVFLQRQAGQLARKGFGKTYVALAEDGVTVVGYVTLSAGQVKSDVLSSHRKLPRYPVPMLRLGRLAVSLTVQGRGLGQQLLGFALGIALEFSERVGLYAVVVDAKHAQAKAFYSAYGFIATLADPLCLYLPIATLHQTAPSPVRRSVH